MTLHVCEPHYAKDKGNIAGYGEAITVCYETEQAIGEFWAANGEYASRVNFCPFCGEKAPSQI